jgi:hypothetical protein
MEDLWSAKSNFSEKRKALDIFFPFIELRPLKRNTFQH